MAPAFSDTPTAQDPEPACNQSRASCCSSYAVEEPRGNITSLQSDRAQYRGVARKNARHAAGFVIGDEDLRDAAVVVAADGGVEAQAQRLNVEALTLPALRQSFPHSESPHPTTQTNRDRKSAP